MKTSTIIIENLNLLFATSIISTGFMVSASIADQTEPLLITFFRFFLAASITLPMVWRHKDFRWPNTRESLEYILTSFCVVAFFWSMFVALKTTTPLNTGTLFTLTPGITAIIGVLLLGEKVNHYLIVAFLLGLIGSVWVIFEGDLQRLISLQTQQGDGLFFAGCVLMSLYAALIKYFHRGRSMLVMTFWVLTFGTAWLFLLCLPLFQQISVQLIDSYFIAALLYLAVFSTLITFYIYQKAAITLGPARVMSYTYFTPAMIACMSAVWYQHGINQAILPGVMITLSAMFYIQYTSPRQSN